MDKDYEGFAFQSIPSQTGRFNLYGTDRPILFYDRFDKNYLNFTPFWAIKDLIEIKNVIKQHGLVGPVLADTRPTGCHQKRH